jgi:4-amino-4-deoxy-L-arabinose transferase-like glycosyltransferase
MTDPHPPLWRTGAACVAAWGVLMAVALWLRPPMPIDETRYLAVAWEMWTGGDQLVPHLLGQPYAHKPPLLFWLIEAGWWVFGVSEWWGRLAAPLAGLGATLLSMDLARRLWPDDGGRSARLAPVLLLGCACWAVFTTLTMFDCLLACCVLVGVHGVAAAGLSDGRRGWTRVALGVGLGILAKGPVALLHLLPALALAPWWAAPAGRLRPAWGRWYAGAALAVLCGLLLALAWALPAAHRGGQAYQDAILWGQTAGRLAGDPTAPELNPHARPWWWYLPMLPMLFFPWSVWPPLWRAAAGWRALRDDLGARLLVAWLAPAFLAFSLIGGKQLHYLVPLLPASALLAARALAERGPEKATRADLGPALSLLAVCAIGLGLAPFVHPRFYAWDNHELSLASWAAATPWWAAPLLAAPLVLAWLMRPAAPAAAARGLALALGAVSVALTVIAAPMTSEAFDLRPLAQDIARWQEEGPVARLTPYYGEYQFLGRLRAPVVRLGADELAGWVRAHEDGRLILGFGAHRPPPPWFGPPESVRSYRGVLLGVWRCSTLRAHLPTAAAIPPRPWRRPRPPYWQRRSRPVVAESSPLLEQVGIRFTC